MSFSSKAKAIRNKVIDKTSDVLSAPKRKYHESMKRGYDRQYNTVKEISGRMQRNTATSKDHAVLNSLKNK